MTAGLALEEDCAGGDEVDPVRAGGNIGGREIGVGGGVFGDEEGGRGGADEETVRRRDVGDQVGDEAGVGDFELEEGIRDIAGCIVLEGF